MIRIGNTAYTNWMDPIDVDPRVEDDFERVRLNFEVDEQTLKDLIDNRPGGIVRVGQLRA